MLKEVEIHNYRGFKSYVVKDLARVNLFVGRNNSGKTALIEGIQFLTSGGGPICIGGGRGTSGRSDYCEARSVGVRSPQQSNRGYLPFLSWPRLCNGIGIFPQGR